MVPFKEESIKVWYSKAQLFGSEVYSFNPEPPKSHTFTPKSYADL